MLDGAESTLVVFGGEAIAARLESVSDVLDSAESIIDVLGGAIDVCVVLLVVVAVTTPTPPISEMVYWPTCSLIYVV